MEMTIRRRSLLAAVAAVAMASATASRAAETHVLKIQTLWQPGTANQQAFERFAKNVADQSNGTIRIQPFPAGALVGTNEMLDAVGRGVLDGMHSAVSYWTGYDPAFAALGDLTAAYDSPAQGEEYFYERGGLELLRQAYAPFDVYPIGVVWWGVESIPTAKKVASIDDFKGVKIRLPQGMASDIFAKFGAVPVNLPGSEVFSAIDNGTIEATDWGTLSMNAELGFHDAVKFAIYPGIHSMPVGDVTISMKQWESLDADQQKLLEQAVRAFGKDMLETLDADNEKAAAKLSSEGVELVSWTAEERVRLRAEAKTVWESYAGKSELSKKVIDSQIDFLKSTGVIQ